MPVSPIVRCIIKCDPHTVERAAAGLSLQQLATGPAFQDERISCEIWQELVVISEESMRSVVHLIWVPGRAGVEVWKVDRMAIRGRY